MFTDNFQEDAEFLESQIVLTLENESTIHRQATEHINANNFELFRIMLFNTTPLERMMNSAKVSSSKNLKNSEILRFIPWAKSRVAIMLWQRMRCNAGFDPDLSPGTGFALYKESLALIHGTDARIADAYSQPLVSQPQPEKEITMAANNNTPFETIHFVYGADVGCMNEEQLIAGIKRAEGEIAQLGTVKAASKKLAAKKEELEAAIAKMVEILDAK